jgi:hypothetical protein
VCHAARGEALRKSLLVYSCLFSFHTKWSRVGLRCRFHYPWLTH